MNKAVKWYSIPIKIIEYLFFVLAFVLITLFFTILIKAKIHPNEIPDVFGYKPLIVLSGSMDPEISKGDLAIVKVTSSDSLKENDIIAFRNDDDTVTTHRIKTIKKENKKTVYITKGDNNNTEDNDYVYQNKVEGLYLFKITGLGNVLMFIQKPVGLIACLFVILSIGTICILLKNQKLGKLSDEEIDAIKKIRENK